MEDAYAPTVVWRYHVSGRRRSFMYPADVYRGWAMLTPVRGTFRYQVERPRGASGASNDPGTLTGVCAPGEIVLCPPGAALRRHLLGPGAFHFAEFVPDARSLPTAGKTTFRDVGRLNSTLHYLAAEYERALGAPTPSMAHLVTDLLLLGSWERGQAQEGGDRIAREAAAHLERHYGSPELSIGSIAAMVGLSASQLTRRFQRTYDMSPAAYRRNLRLGKARRLLVESDDTIQRISAACGYRSPFYFSRVFRAHFGQSPATYRAGHRI